MRNPLFVRAMTLGLSLHIAGPAFSQRIDSKQINYAARWAGVLSQSLQNLLDQQGAQVVADVTGSVDAVGAINAVLASGASPVVLPAGPSGSATYAINSDFIRMLKPNQDLVCQSGVTLLAVRPGHSAAPLAIMFQSATGSRIINCHGNLNGAQFVDSAYLPLVATDIAQYVSGTGYINNSVVTAASVATAGSGYGASLSGTLTWSGSGCVQKPIITVATNSGGGIASVSGIALEGGCTTSPTSGSMTWTVGGGLSAGSGAALTLTTYAKINKNDGLAVAVLEMCDHCDVVGGAVTNGYDNDIMILQTDISLSTVNQLAGPKDARVTGVKTSYAGAGSHLWTPSFFMGCGVDVGSGIDAKISSVEDEFSHIGFCADEGGGASATFTDITSRYAQMTTTPFMTAGNMSIYYPMLSDPWHGSTIGGSGIFIGASSRNNYSTGASPYWGGNVWEGYHATVVNGARIIDPQGVGVWFSRYSNGALLNNVDIERPGLECFWAVGGTHQIDNSYCDEPNFWKGSIPTNTPTGAVLPNWNNPSLGGATGSTTPLTWPQTGAVRAICANGVPFTSGGSVSAGAVNTSYEILNTTLTFNNFRISDVSAQDTGTHTTPFFSYNFITDPAFTGGAGSNPSGQNCAPAIYVYKSRFQYGASGIAYQNTGSTLYIEPMPWMDAPTLSSSCTGLGGLNGNPEGGTFVASNACSAGNLTLNFPYPGPHGWGCAFVGDLTTPANSIKPVIFGSYYTTYTTTITAGDTIAYKGCSPF